MQNAVISGVFGSPSPLGEGFRVRAIIFRLDCQLRKRHRVAGKDKVTLPANDWGYFNASTIVVML
jgi:hypothetical protein